MLLRVPWWRRPWRTSCARTCRERRRSARTEAELCQSKDVRSPRSSLGAARERECREGRQSLALLASSGPVESVMPESFVRSLLYLPAAHLLSLVHCTGWSFAWQSQNAACQLTRGQLGVSKIGNSTMFSLGRADRCTYGAHDKPSILAPSPLELWYQPRGRQFCFLSHAGSNHHDQ